MLLIWMVYRVWGMRSLGGSRRMRREDLCWGGRGCKLKPVPGQVRDRDHHLLLPM